MYIYIYKIVHFVDGILFIYFLYNNDNNKKCVKKSLLHVKKLTEDKCVKIFSYLFIYMIFYT